MKEFNANKKSMLIKGRVWISCIALLPALVVVLSRYDSSDAPALSTIIDGAETSGTTSYSTNIENETGTTAVSKPNQIETSEPSIPNTEAIESVMTDPALLEPEETVSIEGTTPTKLPHSHSYSSTVTKAATCTAKGVKTYTCACGDSYTEDIGKLDHKYTSETVAPTCTTKGYTTYTCACGKSYQDNETKATGHSWGAWSDYVDGKSTRKCTACGKQETRTESDDTNNTAGTGGTKIDPSGDPNGNPASYVAPADPKTGISWDGASPIVYTYTDGTTGTEPRLGATYYINPYRIGTVTAYTLGQMSTEEYLGGASDGNCRHCGKPGGDGTGGTCIRWMVDGTHICKNCGAAVPGKTCHTCPEE